MKKHYEQRLINTKGATNKDENNVNFDQKLLDKLLAEEHQMKTSMEQELTKLRKIYDQG